MKKKEVGCPNCGNLVEFTVSVSLVAVCSSCGSIVARGDRKLEDHGKVSEMIETDSVFHLGQTGRYREHPFEVIGRVQYQHPTGGVWEEWYVAFPGDRWGWLAEAQGKRYFTQSRTINSHMVIPEWDQLTVGSNVHLGVGADYTVLEFATARFFSAEGEIPFAAFASAPHQFADLAGPNNGFATLAYKSDGIDLFLGQEVTLEELGISASDVIAESDQDAHVPIKQGIALTCPHCGGSVELRAPDQSQRVTCAYCASLLDIEGTNLKFLTTLNPAIKPLLPLGTTGELYGTKYTVIGFVRRAVYYDAEYSWDEYLLYEKFKGFRWLAHSDLHWSFIEPTEAVDSNAMSFSYKGNKYQLFQRAWARVLHVYGEFYWKVSVGDTVLMLDFISPPHMISIEETPTSSIPSDHWEAKNYTRYKYSESVFSYGTYITHEEVEAAFKVGPLRRGAAVAPNQPKPSYMLVYVAWVAMVFVLIGIDVYYSNLANHTVDHGWTVIAIILLSLYPVAMIMDLRAFEVSRWADSEFSPYNSNS